MEASVRRSKTVAALLSSREPFDLVNAEAMACATPVIGSKRGGIREDLGDARLLIDPENIEGFADAICILLGNHEYTVTLGCAAYRRCREMFDWQGVAEWNCLLHRPLKLTIHSIAA